MIYRDGADVGHGKDGGHCWLKQKEKKGRRK
jgi:hypothetical protein